jgi:hypothetical protein
MCRTGRSCRAVLRRFSFLYRRGAFFFLRWRPRYTSWLVFFADPFAPHLFSRCEKEGAGRAAFDAGNEAQRLIRGKDRCILS